MTCSSWDLETVRRVSGFTKGAVFLREERNSCPLLAEYVTESVTDFKKKLIL